MFRGKNVSNDGRRTREFQKSIRNEELIPMWIMTFAFVTVAHRTFSAKWPVSTRVFKLGFEVFHEDLSSVTNLVGKLDTHRRRCGCSWLRSQGKTKACVYARVDVRAHARGCATYRGVEEKIGSVTDTWCDGLSLSPFFSPIRDEKEADLGDEETKKKWGGEKERVHLLNLPAVPRVAPAR